jgi:flagellar hook-basal body protein
VDDQGEVINGTGQKLLAFQATDAGRITGDLDHLRVDASNIAPEATDRVDVELNLDAGAETNVHPSLTFSSFTNFDNLDGYSFDLDDGVHPVETVSLNFQGDAGAPDPRTATRAEVAAYIAGKVNATSNFAARVDGSAVVLHSVSRDATLLNVQNLQVPAGHGLPDDPLVTTIPGPGMTATTDTDLDFASTGPTGDAVVSTFSEPFPFDPSEPRSYNNSTSLTVYDSLGKEHLATLYFRKVEPNLWETYMQIDGDTTQTTQLNDISFDSAGKLTTATPMPVSYGVYTPTTGAAPMPITVDFTGTTQFGANFGVNALTQDGFTTGRLTGIDIDDEGIVRARFSNGESKVEGQVALANFANPQGLQPGGDTLWQETGDSGPALVGAAGTASLGLVQAGALEESNVELAEQLVNMIVAQRNYQANAQVIRTEDEVTQTIINIR